MFSKSVVCTKRVFGCVSVFTTIFVYEVLIAFGCGYPFCGDRREVCNYFRNGERLE